MRRAIVEEDIKYAKGYDAAVLWMLHTLRGHGKKRLEEDFAAFMKQREEIREKCLANEDDDAFICQRALLSIGVDMDELYKRHGLDKSRKLIF